MLNGVEPVSVPATAVLKMNANRNFPHGDWVTPILRAREASVAKPVDGLLFRWSDASKVQRALLLEQVGPAAQEGVLEGSLVPFAVLGNTEESGEKVTLENLLDVQHDGVLLYDTELGVHHDDEGNLSAKGITVHDLVVSAATAEKKKSAKKKRK